MASILVMTGPEMVHAFRAYIDTWIEDRARSRRRQKAEPELPRPFRGLKFLDFSKDLYHPSGLYLSRRFILYVEQDRVLGYKSFFINNTEYKSHIDRRRSSLGLLPIDGEIYSGEAVSVAKDFQRSGVATKLTDHLFFDIMKPGDIYIPSSYEPDGIRFTKAYISSRSAKIQEIGDEMSFAEYDSSRRNFLIREAASSSRIADRWLKKAVAGTGIYDIAYAAFDADRMSADFSHMNVVDVTQKPLPDESVRFVADIQFREGFSIIGYKSPNIFRGIITEADRSDVERALGDAVRNQMPQLIKHISWWFTEQTWKSFSGIVGFRESAEWEAPSDVDVLSVKLLGKPFSRRPYLPDSFHQGFEVKVSMVSRQKAPVTFAPFIDMSDAELDSIIWDNEGSEGVYMDGEIGQRELPSRMRQLRKVYREMSPRQQTSIMNRG